MFVTPPNSERRSSTFGKDQQSGHRDSSGTKATQNGGGGGRQEGKDGAAYFQDTMKWDYNFSPDDLKSFKDWQARLRHEHWRHFQKYDEEHQRKGNSDWAGDPKTAPLINDGF